MKTGSQLGPPHKHCVVCGKPISTMYTAPGEPPLCSADCRAKYEAQKARASRWQSMFNAMLVLMLLWLLFAFLLSTAFP